MINVDINKEVIELKLQNKGLQQQIRILDDKIKELKGFQSKALESVKEGVNELFESGEFYGGLKKYLMTYIEDEIRTRVNNLDIMDDLKKVSAQQVKHTVKRQFDTIVPLIVEKVIKVQMKKYQYEYNAAKKLTYSVDAGIKQMLKHHPITMDFEKTIINQMKRETEQIAGFLLSQEKSEQLRLN